MCQRNLEMSASSNLEMSVKDNDGALVFKRPLWIGIIGARKDEVSSEMAYNTYLNRYDIEHFFRFGGYSRYLMSAKPTNPA